MITNEPRTIILDPDSELARVLDETDAPIVLQSNGVRYQVRRVPETNPAVETRHPRNRLEPKRVLNIIGLGASAEGSDIANHKDRYIADAVDHRGG